MIKERLEVALHRTGLVRGDRLVPEALLLRCSELGFDHLLFPSLCQAAETSHVCEPRQPIAVFLNRGHEPIKVRF
jgi:hypothetical protein